MSEKILSDTLENYIKVIGEILQEKEVARVKDIAEKLGVKLSTVTSTLKTLTNKGYIIHKPYQYIILTEKGKKIADDLLKKKRVLVSFLEEVLDISEEDAKKIACNMEHSISDDNLNKFRQFLVFIDNCPFRAMEMKNRFKEFLQKGGNILENCENCLDNCMEDYLKENSIDLNNENTTTLNKLKIGEKAKILKIRKNPLLARRFCEMGGVAGTIIKIEKIAPLGDPISLKIKESEISIRKEEAENIIVQKIN